MKTLIKTILYLQMTALCLATAFAAPNLKEKDFRGSIKSFETAEFVGTTMFVDGSGTGRATHLGRFTYTFEFVVDLLHAALHQGVEALGSLLFIIHLRAGSREQIRDLPPFLRPLPKPPDCSCWADIIDPGRLAEISETQAAPGSS